MEGKDRIVTQEEYAEIESEITMLEMEQALTGKDNTERIKELKERIS